MICELVSDAMYIPMKEKEMAAFMQVSKEEREDFRRLLQVLVSEGRLQTTTQGNILNRRITGTRVFIPVLPEVSASWK